MPLEPISLDPRTADILELAMSAQSIERELDAYRGSSSSDRELFVWIEDGRTVAAAGVLATGNTAQLLHIATALGFRRQGIGQRLVHGIVKQLRLTNLWAETDDDAVDFYQRTGFEVMQMPSPWPRARYRCTLAVTH